MKTKKRLRLMPMLITVMMAFAMVPVMGAVAYAEESYNLWVGSEEVTSEKTSGSGWSYAEASNTLTLTDAVITKGYTGVYAISGIYYNGTEDLNIVLEGDNSIQASQGETQLLYGIYSSRGGITISGDGKLSADAENVGIYGYSTLTIEGGVISASGDTGFQAGSISISGGEVKAIGGKGDGISGKSIEISKGSVEATGSTAGLNTSGEDIVISGGKVIASATGSSGNGIQSSRHIDIKGGTVEATGANLAILAAGNVEISGGSVIASGGAKGIDVGRGFEVIIGRNVVVMAGNDKNNAKDVTDTFEANHDYKWVNTETVTLWVGGIPVTSRNAEDILGDGDQGATASYNDKTKTLTLNDYSYESEGYKFIDDSTLPDQYAAIYANQELTIQLEGDNTVKCTEKDSSIGSGIHAISGITIQGSGTLTASGYGDGAGIYTRDDDIRIKSGTVTASGCVGMSTDGDKIIIDGGIVTASGSDRGFSGYDVTAADDMGINAGSSKETAIDVDKESFERTHLQKWVQVAKAYPLWVVGKRVTVVNMGDVLSDATVSYDPGTNTLKLNGANIAADPQYQKENAAIYCEGEKNNLTINATKDSIVKGPDHDDPHEKSSYGIFSKSPLTVKGKLTASGDTSGIFLGGGSDGVIAVNSGAELIATGNTAAGIASNAGKGAVIIDEGAKVSAASGKTGAVDAIVKNAVSGIGWTNREGTEGKTVFKINKQGQTLGKRIKKAVFPAPKAAVTKAPAARNLTHNSSAQELVTAGAAKNGTMRYALGKDAATPPEKGWSASIPKGTDDGDYYVWYRAFGDEFHEDSDAACVKATIAKKNDPKPTPVPARVSGTPVAKMTARGNTGMTISWNKIKGAAGYDIFFTRCNHSGKVFTFKKIKTVKGNKTFKWTRYGLKKGKAYKAYVKAYVMKNGKKSYVRTSPMIHAYTGNGTKNYTNARSVTIKNVKKGKLSLKKGKTFKIKARVIKVNKKKKLMAKSHAPTLRYMSSNRKVAKVSSGGRITAKGKGACYVYVYAHNGVSKKIKVTVK